MKTHDSTIAPSTPPLLRRSDLSVSALVAGVIAIVIGYAGPAVVIFRAADAGGLTAAQTSSWILVASVSCGVIGLALTLWTRTPIVVAWSTPGAAVLVTAIGDYAYSDVIGAYLVAAVAMTALAASGLFDALMRRLPTSLVSAMLAGILFRFVADAFGALATAPAIAGAVIAAFLVTRRWSIRWAVPAALLAGVVVSALLGDLELGGVRLRLAAPVFTAPTFDLGAMVGVALPLFVVTLTAQNAAGLGVLRSLGYPADARRLVTATGLGSVVGAAFGSHAINLAAITAALCAGPTAHPDPYRRWPAGVSAGVCYLVIGVFGGTLIAVFGALPGALIASLAGVALVGSFAGAVSGAVADPHGREAAVICFAATASGLTVAGIGAPFWGLLLGAIAQAPVTWRRPSWRSTP